MLVGPSLLRTLHLQHHLMGGGQFIQRGSAAILPSLLGGATKSIATTSTALAAAATSFEATNQVDILSKAMPNLPPRARSAVYMAAAMAFHFGGYEFVRSANLALFTSTTTGFSHPSAFPLAMALVSPFSLILLGGYGRELEDHGPRVALRHTTLLSIFVIGMAAVVLTVLQNNAVVLVPTGFTLSQLLVGFIFVFQNSYAHLLYTQQWSFLGSILTPAEGSTWFAAVAGLSSITCSVAGTIVPSLVRRVGLVGLMACTSITLVMSLLLSEQAYATSEKFDFDPAEEMRKKQQKKKKEDPNAVSAHHHSRLIPTAIDLFRRVPTLGALFCEVISYQSLSTVVNTCLVTQLKASITNDVLRAAWTGRFFALINGFSGLLQFLILPLFMKRLEPRVVLRYLPVIPVGCAFFQCFRSDPSLTLLAFSFFCIKTLDYSFRGVVNEIVYQPLDFESRYLGKEIIQVFGGRVGKSGMSLCLSALSYLVGADRFGTRQLSQLSTFVALSWLSSTWSLSRLVLSKDQAEKIVAERQHRANQQKEQDKKDEAQAKQDEESKKQS